MNNLRITAFLFILGAAQPAVAEAADAFPSPLIGGLIEGCIDGQKRSLADQGLPYRGNEELVRQYCWCMASVTADIAASPDGRAKMLDGDPKIKARLQKVDAACLDGLRNSRTFAPPAAKGK